MEENRQLIEICTKKLGKEPNHIKALFLRANSYIKIGEYDKAEKDINTILNNESNNSTAFFLLGCIYEKQKKYDDSIKHLSKAIEFDPNNINAYYLRGAVYNELGYFQKAIDDYNLALERDTLKIEKKNMYKTITKVLRIEDINNNQDEKLLNKNNKISDVEINAEINNYVYNQLKSLSKNNQNNFNEDDKVQEIYNPSDVDQSKKLFKDINNNPQINSILEHQRNSLINNSDKNKI